MGIRGRCDDHGCFSLGVFFGKVCIDRGLPITPPKTNLWRKCVAGTRAWGLPIRMKQDPSAARCPRRCLRHCAGHWLPGAGPRAPSAPLEAKRPPEPGPARVLPAASQLATRHAARAATGRLGAPDPGQPHALFFESNFKIRTTRSGTQPAPRGRLAGTNLPLPSRQPRTVTVTSRKDHHDLGCVPDQLLLLNESRKDHRHLNRLPRQKGGHVPSGSFDP
jgi:hypothetical protein